MNISGNGIDIVIRAIDQFTRPMQGIVSNARGQAMSLAGIANTGPQGLVGSALFGAGAGAIMASLTLVTGGVALLTRELNRAANVEVQVIGKSHDIAKNFQISPDRGREIYNEVEGDLAKAAGPLPGSTQDYTGVFNQISTGLSRAIPDEEEFKRLGVDMSKRIGVLAVKSGADASMGGSAMNRAILGTSGLGELRQIDIFQKSDVGVAITDELAKLGKTDKDWKSLTAALRVKVLENALIYATPDAMIDDMSSSAAAITESWISNLFDPLVGIFGTRRFVESRGKSALDAYTEYLKSIEYFFTAMGRANGLENFDPMAPIIDLIDWLRDYTDRFSRALDTGLGFFKSIDLGYRLGEGIGWLVGQIFKLGPLVMLNLDKILGFFFGLIVGVLAGLANALAATANIYWKAFKDWLLGILNYISDKLLGWLPGYESKLERETKKDEDVVTGDGSGSNPFTSDNAAMSLGSKAREWVVKAVGGNPKPETGGNTYAVNVEANGITDPDAVAGRAVDRLKQLFRERSEAQLAT